MKENNGKNIGTYLQNPLKFYNTERKKIDDNIEKKKRKKQKTKGDLSKSTHF